MRFSPSTQVGYPEDRVYASIPDDVITLTADEWTARLNSPPGSIFSVVNGVFTITSPDTTLTQSQVISNLITYATSTTNRIISSMNTYTSGSSTIRSDCTSGTIANWLALQQWAAISPTDTRNWITNDSSVETLAAADVSVISYRVGIFAQSVWDSLANVIVSINSGAITTNVEIDAYAWPTVT